MSLTVVFSLRAEALLADLYDYIAVEATPVTAERYTTAIVDYCLKLAAFPDRAPARDDIRPGLRATRYRGRTIIPTWSTKPPTV
ncbi:MAG: type II toxin-antitoxin system RelE/ParE family toxin [Burkholderiaceae bacterium]